MKNKRYIPATNKNTIGIVKMRMIGYTFAEIGSAFGVTRQRAFSIWKRYKQDHNI